MFGIGFPELIVICIVALIFIGPKKLPELMRQGGKLFVQLRRTANDVRSTFDQVVHEAEEEMRRAEAETLRQAILADHVKSPKLLDAATTSTSPTDHHDDEGPHHADPHHDHHDNAHGHHTPENTPAPEAPEPHDPHRPDGALPFQPNLLGSTLLADERALGAGTSASDSGTNKSTAKAPSGADPATAEAPTTPKDSPVS